jgi:hypothetical protein
MAAHRLARVRKVFGVEKLSPQQEKAINGLMNGKDVFVSLRTGGGKSLCYMAFPMFCVDVSHPWVTDYDALCDYVICSCTFYVIERLLKKLITKKNSLISSRLLQE